MNTRIVLIATATTVLIALAACEEGPVRPARLTVDDEPFGVAAVPLSVGSVWTYHHDFTNEWFSDGGISLPPPIHLTATGTRTLSGTETIGGVEYVVEHQHVVSNAGPPADQWRRYRQDEAGLYRADVSLNAAPGQVADEEVDELTRLVLPLEVGASWMLRPGDGSVAVTVEALDTLSVGGEDTPAFRMRIDVATDGDDDLRLLWYGQAGLLRRVDHKEIVAFDPATQEMVRIVSHEIEELTAVELAE